MVCFGSSGNQVPQKNPMCGLFLCQKRLMFIYGLIYPIKYIMNPIQEHLVRPAYAEAQG